MKKLIILFAIVAYASTCFGYTNYDQKILVDRQNYVTTNYQISGPSGYYAADLSYSFDAYVYPGTTQGKTIPSTCSVKITIYDIYGGEIPSPKIPYFTYTSPSGGNSNFGDVYKLTYAYPYSGPFIGSATVQIYAESSSPNAMGGYVWGELQCSTWISII